jgi:hypothetical protein
VSVDWEQVRELEKILPCVWEASLDELDAAGWGWYPRRFIPENWREGPPSSKGGKPRIYITEVARLSADREARERYEAKRKAARVEATRRWRRSKGAKARTYTPELRSEIGKLAAEARWGQREPKIPAKKRVFSILSVQQ